ncbi:unnamed protein product [Rangifer tarandus platyrhynchus]|uniref:Uncharacterized protein n=2 Tax=Rangifer tarandus platyrhynchus TaxID=3082113 RepID=A0ABN8Y6X9_RANTA|nr:unnamed protein product [Rangifer tarandus platyrhynchus]
MTMHFQASQYLQFLRFHICPLPPSFHISEVQERQRGWLGALVGAPGSRQVSQPEVHSPGLRWVGGRKVLCQERGQARRPVLLGHRCLLEQTHRLCCSVAMSCPTLCDLMDCSTLGFPVLHYLPGFAQTHVPWVRDTIQPSHPLSSPSPPALNLSQHQGLFQ